MKRSLPASAAMAGLGFLLPALASFVARRIAGQGFQSFTHKAPPRNPAAPGVTWKHALLWTALSGALGGVCRMFARRGLVRIGLPAEGYNLGHVVRSIARKS